MTGPIDGEFASLSRISSDDTLLAALDAISDRIEARSAMWDGLLDQIERDVERVALRGAPDGGGKN